MKRFAKALGFAVAGYLIFALISYFLILNLSSNTHDRSLEASMTAAFIFGPVGAFISFIISLFRKAS